MRDETGGIEGMPLQLMITVIVAGLVLAVVLGWVLTIQSPSVIKSVSTDPASVDLGNIPEDLAASKTVTIRVTPYDAEGAPIRDAVVTAEGAIARTVVAFDKDDGASDGTVTLTVRAHLAPAVNVGELSLTIQKAGYPSKSWSVPVVRGA
jgi:hypothetical protein